MLIFLLLGLSSLAAILLFIKTVWVLRRFHYQQTSDTSVDVDELPSVSVCIAARNEMHALAQCLEQVIRSDYPKMEILVLDDSSHDNTSLIIKSFAQAGVRFIAGSPLPNGWIGKNHAYQTLIDESSGDYILFLDVDTSLSTNSISQLVKQLMINKRAMISVLPRREDSFRASALFGTMRYYWELLLSSTVKPPAASAIWMVSRNTLAETGIGLSNYSMSVRPERHLAGELQKRKLYYYVIGSRKLGVAYEKRLKSQYETALRLYYPASGRHFISWLAAGLYVVLLILPLIILFSQGISNIAALIWAAGICTLECVTFGLFTVASYGSVGWLFRVAIGPWLFIQEFILLTLSYLLYRLNKITWKGRLVTAQPAHSDALRVDE